MIPTTLQRYVLRETLHVALLATVALTAIIFVGTGISLVNHGLSVVQLRGIVPYIFAFSLPFAVPMALLLASVFVFGRLSGANEITAIRSSGINLNHVIAPLLLLAVLLCAGTFWLNQYVLPWGHAHKKEMAARLIGRAVTKIGNVQKVFPLKEYVIYVGRVDETSGMWENVAVVQFADDEFPARIMIAKRARCIVDEENDLVRLTLYNVILIQPQLGKEFEEQQPKATFKEVEHVIDLSKGRFVANRPKYDQLPQLVRRIRTLEKSAAETRRHMANPQDLDHPREARRAAQKTMDKAYRAWRGLDSRMGLHHKAIEQADASVEKAEMLLNGARGNHGAALQERDDVATKIRDREPTLEKMKAELRALVERKVEPDQAKAHQALIRERQEELKKEWKAIDGLHLLLSKAEIALAKADGEVRVVEGQMAARQAELDRVKKELAAARGHALDAYQTYLVDRKRVDEIKAVESLLRARTEFHYRNAGSVTTLIFAMIGIPLGILSRRGSVLMAFILSFFAVLVLYYPLMMVGQMLSLDGYMASALAGWLPNMVVGGIGAYLLAFGIRR